MKKYFPKLLGNDDVRARIGAAIERGRAPHAFLISGPKGSGKLTLATEIAAALNCERGEVQSASLPCCECDTCKRIYSGNYTDIKMLEKPRDRATIGVDPVKDMREDMFLSATEAQYKIYIIRDAETMTTEAQNALLKVLEEPPSRVVILLLATECDKILTTIKSRVQYVSMARFTEGEITEYLTRASDTARSMAMTDKERLHCIILASDGVLGRAIKLTDKKLADENEAERLVVLDFIRSLRAGASYADVYTAAQGFPSKRPELQRTIESIISCVRDLLTVKYSDRSKIIFCSSREEARELADSIGTKRLISIYDALTEAHEYCSKNAGVANLVTNLVAKASGGR